jgi:hypothetical protein
LVGHLSAELKWRDDRFPSINEKLPACVLSLSGKAGRIRPSVDCIARRLASELAAVLVEAARDLRLQLVLSEQLVKHRVKAGLLGLLRIAGCAEGRV